MMFQFKDGLLLVVAFASMLIGTLLPKVGEPFQWAPMPCMMALLFFSFLSVRLGDMVVSVKKSLATLGYFVFTKLVLLPILVFFAFQYLCPKYALSALLLSGVSSGTASPFFAILVNANISIVLGMVVLSSVLVPFTLPAMTKLLMGRSMEISFLSMSQLLCIVVFIPLILAEVMKRISPAYSDKLFNAQYPIALVSFIMTNLGIFSKYSDFLHQEPIIFASSLGITFVLAGIYFLAGLIFSFRHSVADRLSLIVSLGIMNSVLVLVFSSEFFGPLEATVAALYSVPFFVLILPMRVYQSWAERGPFR